MESALTAQIFALLEHYKNPDPVGLPGAPVPDPFPVDDVKRSIGMGTLTMKNTKAYGFSKFRIKSVKLDLNELMVSAAEIYNCCANIVFELCCYVFNYLSIYCAGKR